MDATASPEGSFSQDGVQDTIGRGIFETFVHSEIADDELRLLRFSDDDKGPSRVTPQST